MSGKSKSQGTIPPVIRPESKSPTPFFKDRTEEAVKHGIGYTLMGPNIYGGTPGTIPTNPEPQSEDHTGAGGSRNVEGLNLLPPPQRANFNSDEAYQNCKDL